MLTLAEQAGNLRAQYPGLSRAAAARLIRRYDTGGREYRRFLRKTAGRWQTALAHAEERFILYGTSFTAQGTLAMEYMPAPRSDRSEPILSITRRDAEPARGLTSEDIDRALEWLSRPRPNFTIEWSGTFADDVRRQMLASLGVLAAELRPDGPQSAVLAQEGL